MANAPGGFDPETEDFNFGAENADPSLMALAQQGSGTRTQTTNTGVQSKELPSAFSNEELAQDFFGGQDEPQQDAGQQQQTQQPQRQRPAATQNSTAQDHLSEGAPRRPLPPHLRGQDDALSDEPGDVVFPPELLRESGLTEQQARQQFGSPDGLERAVRFHDQQLIRLSRQQPGQQQWGQQQFQPQPQFNQFGQQQFPQQGLQQQQFPQQQQQFFPQQFGQQPMQGQQQQMLPQQQQLAKYEVKLNPEQFDPEVIEGFTKMNDHYHAQFERQAQENQFLRQSMLRLVEHASTSSTRAEYEQFDAAVNGLPDGFKETFGEGTIDTLERGGLHWQQRARLDAAVIGLQNQRVQRGLPRLSVKEAVKRAASAEFPDIYDTTIRKQVTQNVKQRQGQFTARPTGRRTSAAQMTPEDRAISRLNKKFAEIGHNAPVAEADEEF